MKTLIKHITLACIAAFILSCSDEFVNDKTDISGVATSTIIIAPTWESDNYQFQCENAGNSDFKIESKPQWLVVNNTSGKFENGIATITCKANNYDKFANTGVYIDQMMIVAGGKKYAVPVYYINEGEPHILAPASFTISYSSDNSQYLQIRNTGDGILLWDIISMPEWLAVDISRLNISYLMIAKNANVGIPFTFNPNSTVTGNVSGVIVLSTNDKSKPTVSINVTADLGTPQLSFYLYNNLLDFGISGTGQSVDLGNYGNGILVWSVEDLPEWLSINKTNGVLYSYSGEYLFFSCNHSKLSVGQTSTVIYLKSNDPTNPSIAITVTARTPGSNVNVLQHAPERNIVDATS
jgi:hypothetical protein